MNTYREFFPLLQKTINGHPLVYFDNAATTPKPEQVIASLADHYREHNGNPGRGTHQLARESARVIEDGRAAVKQFLSIPSHQTTVFTKNCTESINLVARLFQHSDSRQKTIVITQAEHHANYLPWVRLAKEFGFKLIIAPVLTTAEIDYNSLEKIISTEKPALVAINYVSNVTGKVTNIKWVSDLCSKHGSKLLIDAAQATSHIKIDLTAIPCDYVAASAHKAYGPEGVGILVLPTADLEQGEPLLLGGGIVANVTDETYTLKTTEERFEAGTQNIAGIAGFITALKFLSSITFDYIQQQEELLTNHFLKVFGERHLSLRLIAVPQHPIFSFVTKVHPHDIADYLDEQGIAVRAGNHCAQPLHHALAITSSTRVSLAFYNTTEEIDYLFDVLTSCLKKFD